MDEKDIVTIDNGSDSKDKMSFNKKYLITISIIAVVLIITMTLLGVLIGYNVGVKKESDNLVQVNPNIVITPSDKVVGVQDIVPLIEKSVVQITAKLANGTSRGSGVIYLSSGYIMTNAHVIAGAQSPGDIKVSLYNGNEYTVVDFKMDEIMDIAYIKIVASEELYPATIADSTKIRKGERVIVIGNPLGTLGGSVTDGIVSALDREIIVDNRPMKLLQTNAEINPGNSGGGMFDMNGSLIGIVNAKSTATEIEGIGFAIPINDAFKIAECLRIDGYVKGRIDTGIMPVYIQTAMDMLFTFQSLNGEYPAVYVYDINKRLEGKVQKGDQIVAINGVVIRDLVMYNEELAKFKMNDTVKFTLKRAGTLVDADIKLVEYKG